MNEKVFFQQGDVTVTNARFIVGGQTFAMSNVTSVSSAVQEPKRLGGLACLLLGLAVAVASKESNGQLTGLVIGVASAFYLYKQKPLHHVMLKTSGGETKALSTYDGGKVSGVVAALNESIVHRG